jgi:hypothetical protein
MSKMGWATLGIGILFFFIIAKAKPKNGNGNGEDFVPSIDPVTADTSGRWELKPADEITYTERYSIPNITPAVYEVRIPYERRVRKTYYIGQPPNAWWTTSTSIGEPQEYTLNDAKAALNRYANSSDGPTKQPDPYERPDFDPWGGLPRTDTFDFGVGKNGNL